MATRRRKKSSTKRPAKRRKKRSAAAPYASTTKRRRKRSTTTRKKRTRKVATGGNVTAQLRALRRDVDTLKHDQAILAHTTVGIVNIFRKSAGKSAIATLPGYKSPLARGPAVRAMLGAGQ